MILECLGGWPRVCAVVGLALMVSCKGGEPNTPPPSPPAAEATTAGGAPSAVTSPTTPQPGRAPRLAMGQNYLCIQSDQAVRCMQRGTLPFGGLPTSKTPVAIEGVVQVGVGENHACVLNKSGAVACWGANDVGQLGDGTTTPRSERRDVLGLPPAVYIGVGHRMACALVTSGAVYCWGGMFTKRTQPVEVLGLSNVQSLAAGFTTTCALRSDGSVWCWGDDLKPAPVPGIDSATEVTVGSHTCVLRKDGIVLCWGNNRNGQLGTGDGDSRDIALPVPGIQNAAQVSAGPYHTCARLQDGSVWCWGGSSEDDPPPWTPTKVVGVEGASDLIAGYDGGCALHGGGEVMCWSGSVASLVQ